MTDFQLSLLVSTTAAFLILFLEKRLNCELGFLRNDSTPESVSGGLLVAVLLILLHVAGGPDFSFNLDQNLIVGTVLLIGGYGTTISWDPREHHVREMPRSQRALCLRPRPPDALDLIDELSLGIFLAMSLMRLQLWSLVGFALPMPLSLLQVFRLMGRLYDAALICAVFGGIAPGSTPTAMANRTE